TDISVSISKPPEKVVQKAYVVYEPQKNPLIQKIIRETPHRSLIVFCSRKQTVKQLTQILKRAKFNVAEIHSDLEQSEREDLLQGFRSGRIPVIVATDVLSRGIDIDTIDVVINYDVPNDGEDYVHRIGRTARAERDGKAFTLVSDREIGRFSRIEQLIGREVEKAEVPAELGETPAYLPRQKGGGRFHGHHHPGNAHRGKGNKQGRGQGGQRRDAPSNGGGRPQEQRQQGKRSNGDRAPHNGARVQKEADKPAGGETTAAQAAAGGTPPVA
ncbi:MAG: C-terminal helicase domain-containing protein, partial [Flavihumibacter sp.]